MAGGGDGGSLRVSERENIRPSANFSNFCLQGNRVSQDTAVGGGGDNDGGRSGGRKETSCWRCGSTEHMSWSPQCPKYDKEDADRRKAKRDAEREAEKKKDE